MQGESYLSANMVKNKCVSGEDKKSESVPPIWTKTAGEKKLKNIQEKHEKRKKSG